MRENTKKALELLSGGGFTCVLYNGERMYTDTKRGVAPLLQLLESKESLSGFLFFFLSNVKMDVNSGVNCRENTDGQE